MSEFPGFPTLPASGAAQKLPLTARATVTAATSSGMGPPAPVQVASKSSNLEHRNKRDPLLTRLLYGMLAWVTGNVPLEKGYSQVDWMRLMRGTPQARLRRDITMAEVKQHRTREDAWMVFRNKVYNITPYFKFHPGGADMLLKAAGRDGTSLFMKYHPWVNIDALMEKCLLGTLAEETPAVGLGAGAKGVQGEGVAAAALQGKRDGIEGGKGQLLPLAKEGGDGVGDGQEWQVAAATGPGSVGGDAPAQPGQDDMNALVPGDAGNEAAGQKQ